MLDARMRDFEVPAFMQVTPGTGSGNALCVVQAWTHMTREVGTCCKQVAGVTGR